ncbi:MAG: aldo/keto reductase [Devosia sp.]
MTSLAQLRPSPDGVAEIELNDGKRIPQLGMGVWEVDPGITARVVGEGIEAGYRLIDTAEGYHNEEGVGEAVKRASVPRDELFITSKLRNGAHRRDDALRAFDATMQALELDVLDMFMIHWPVPGQDKYVEAWRTLIELRDQGRVGSIGVCNFNPDHVARIVKETGVTPAINQIELHPYFPQRDKRAPMLERGIAIECYSPLGHGDTLKDPVIAEIGKAHGKSAAQVIIRWHLQQGLIAIPRSIHAERLRDNRDVFDFSLSDTEMQRLSGLDKGEAGRTGSDPATNNDLF